MVTTTAYFDTWSQLQHTLDITYVWWTHSNAINSSHL